jgi:pilus assembly protein FimV
MAYNKSRHIEAAQKYLHQGKIAQAIGEYQQMLKQEPKDQVTLMTIGDLFVRQGETFQALEYFERLAQIFLAEGFVSKAVAVYKKIAKLAPEETRPVERLAELYVQQGVLSEARPIYLQLAEVHLRAGRQQQAVGLLRKLLEAEPDNLRVRVRLAELSLTAGETAEAVAAFRAAAEILQRRGEHAEAIKHADRALKADPDDLPTLALKARILAAGSHRSDAIALLQSLPGLDEGGETTDLLIDLYLESGENDAASELATKIFARDAALFAPAHHVANSLLEGEQPEQALPLLNLIREATTDAGNHEQLAEVLMRAAEKLPVRTEPREWLVEHYGRISDSFRLGDAQASLAEAYEAIGNIERATQIYKQLLERNPENEQIRRKYVHLQNPGGRGIEPEDEPVDRLTDALSLSPTAAGTEDALAAEVEPDEETQRYAMQVLTDVDLFSSYGLSQKAIELLEGLLQRTPRHVTALERLLDLHLGAGNERRTAELAALLQQIHGARGDATAADRFADLQRRYGRAADASEDAPEFKAPEFKALDAKATDGQVPEFQAMAAQASGVAAPEPAASIAPETQPELSLDETPEFQLIADLAEAELSLHTQSAPSAEEQDEGIVEEEVLGEAASSEAVREVDLSEEWEALTRNFSQQDSVAPFEIPQAPPEPEQAAQLEQEPEPERAELQDEDAEGVVEESDAGPAVTANTGPQAATEFVIPSPAPDSVREAAAAEDEFSLDPPPEYELELDSLGILSAEDADDLDVDELLKGLSNDFTGSLPKAAPAQEISSSRWQPAEPAEHPAEPRVPAMQTAASEPSQGHGALSEVFEEFRAGLDDAGNNGDDLETHYNLGTAYREMGLLDEAISEFQKVAKSTKKGEFRYAMQCFTLLGLAFMEKSQPSIAAMWYERALEIPGLDQESVLALRYDLGVAQELAGDTSAARRSFSQVYGVNIDYRDVAERLAALGKGR